MTFKQNGSCLTGTLTDPNIPSNLPQSGPINGTIRGNAVTFSFAYPASMTLQGTRTYTGTISGRGAVSGPLERWGHRALHRHLVARIQGQPGLPAVLVVEPAARVLRPQSLAHPERPDGRHAERGVHPRRPRPRRT